MEWLKMPMFCDECWAVMVGQHPYAPAWRRRLRIARDLLLGRAWFSIHIEFERTERGMRYYRASMAAAGGGDKG
jgi:hypothetical protein